MREQKGITLVALIITIVVLLILAGVTITSLGGNDSIINKSREAKEAYENDEATTKNILTEAEEFINSALANE